MHQKNCQICKKSISTQKIALASPNRTHFGNIFFLLFFILGKRKIRYRQLPFWNKTRRMGGGSLGWEKVALDTPGAGSNFLEQHPIRNMVPRNWMLRNTNMWLLRRTCLHPSRPGKKRKIIIALNSQRDLRDFNMAHIDEKPCPSQWRSLQSIAIHPSHATPQQLCCFIHETELSKLRRASTVLFLSHPWFGKSFNCNYIASRCVTKMFEKLRFRFWCLR